MTDPTREWPFDRLRRENAELREDRDQLQQLFDLQRTRMTEAHEFWWEAGNDRNVLPDLGEILGWLCAHIRELRERAERAEDAYQEQKSDMGKIRDREGLALMRLDRLRDAARKVDELVSQWKDFDESFCGCMETAQERVLCQWHELREALAACEPGEEKGDG